MNFIEEFNIDLDICDDLIVYMETNPNKFAGISGMVVDQSRKKSIDCVLSDDVLLEKYKENLEKCIKIYKEKYIFSAISPSCVQENINIQKYHPEDAYFEWHCERASGEPIFSKRHLVFMTYLNDVTDQGETEFLYQNTKFKPKKGLTLIWPADWTHTHRGIPSPTQTKYIITGWISF